MKNLLITMLILTASMNFHNLFCQTEISGIISSDTTLSLSYSPYVVTGNIMVNSTATLTIEPGVELRFEKSVGMLINGDLVARGTQDKYIIFTSNQNMPHKGDWSCLKFALSSGSVLEYCIIEYAGNKGNNGTVILENSYPYINHSIIRNGGTCGLLVDNTYPGSLKITNSIINDNGKSPVVPWGGGISISNCQYILITGNSIFNNQSSGIKLMSGTGSISNNEIYGNYASNEYGGGIGTDGGNVVVTYNIIRNNSAGFGGGIENGMGGGKITKNIILQNSASEGAACWGSFDSLFKNIIVQNSSDQNIIRYSQKSHIYMNQLIMNVSPEIIYNYYGITDSPGSSFIHNTTFLNNDDSNKSSLIQCFNTNPTLNYNNFIEDSLVYIVYNQDNSNTSTIDAKNNYWGTSQTSNIDNKIFDFNDDFSQGLVNYKPILSALDTVSPISPPRNVFKKDLGNGNIQLYWKSNEETDLKGYKIYWKPKSCYSFDKSIDAGNSTTFTLSDLNIDDTLAVTAYDNSVDGIDDQFDGNESWYSYAQKLEDTTVFVNEPTHYNYNIDINPNPFVNFSEIKYALPNTGSISIKVFNIIGTFEQELVNNPNHPPGEFKVLFDASNLPAGIYFYSLKTPDFMETKKMVIIK
jgi:hypothetical protein